MSAVERFTDPPPPRFYPRWHGDGYGWSVIEEAPNVYRIAAGSFTYRAQAQEEADRLNAQNATSIAPTPAETTPADVLAAIATALRSLALQADRYDDEIAGIRVAVSDLIERMARIESALQDDPGVHSVIV